MIDARWRAIFAIAWLPGNPVQVFSSFPSEVIDSLLLLWTASQASEWRNAIFYLPFR
jgi:hypothetical protein